MMPDPQDDTTDADKRWSNPFLEVIMSDGSSWTVQTYNPDVLRYERTAREHGWGQPGGGNPEPFQWLTFLAWSAGRRERRIGTDVKWEAFRDELCLQVSAPNMEPVPPTGPGPEPG